MELENPYAPPSAKSPAVRPSNRHRGGLWDGNWISFTFLPPQQNLWVRIGWGS
jgi:hypothetical protein